MRVCLCVSSLEMKALKENNNINDNNIENTDLTCDYSDESKSYINISFIGKKREIMYLLKYNTIIYLIKMK